MKKGKKYDAVQDAREIKEKLSLKYWDKPEELVKALKAARDKFGVQEKNKAV